MSKSVNQRHPWQRLLGGLGMLSILGATGCQVEIGGQTLPSGYWQTDDVQYYAPGPEFKLSREAAAMKAAKQEQLRGGQGPQAQAPNGADQGPAPAPDDAP
ncbi:MAG TPA: hypothetical protein VGX76_02430 [Pirellulales bacterium]|jgi:hypothetical protein|nr:hypothetical protein [Pirellulales bacterium]